MKDTTIRILGIDPGINNTGWNISQFNTENEITTVLHFDRIQANALAKKEKKQDFKDYGNIVSLELYEREINSIIEKYRPSYVACEDAFYNPRTPNAFLSLKLCIYSIKRVLHTHGQILFLIPPTIAKQAVWGSGTANKLAVQESIFNLKDLVIKDSKTNPIDKMVEHEADSIAISYAFIKNILPDLLLQK